MTRPRKYLIRMIVFVFAAIILCGVLFLPLREAFMANAPLNGLIIGVLVKEELVVEIKAVAALP